MPPATKKCSRCNLDRPRLEYHNNSSSLDGKSIWCASCANEYQSKYRQERKQQEQNGELVPVGKQNLTPEERQRRSDHAKRQVAKGQIGGSKFGRLGGRPRVRAINEHLLNEIKETNGDDILRAFRKALKSQSAETGLRAVKFAVELERSEDERKLRARGGVKAPDEMSEGELVEFVAQAINSKIESGELSEEDIFTLPPEAIHEIDVEATAS